MLKSKMQLIVHYLSNCYIKKKLIDEYIKTVLTHCNLFIALDRGIINTFKKTSYNSRVSEFTNEIIEYKSRGGFKKNQANIQPKIKVAVEK